VRDTEEVKIKTALRSMVDTFPGVDLVLTPSQSVVFRGIKTEDKEKVEELLKSLGVKLIEEVDPITRGSIACPAFPLCGLAITEAERVQPEINSKIWALMNKLGLGDQTLVTRTTGCPNGCTRPYMAELAFVGSGPNAYQVWIGGHPAQAGRTAYPTHLSKMKFKDMDATLEPMFAMWRDQRSSKDESFGDFTFRVGLEAVQAFMETYVPGSAFAPQMLPTNGTGTYIYRGA
jgi:sulfite reductase (ferredoxin)